MIDVGGATNTWEAQSRNMINICTKYGFDSSQIKRKIDAFPQITVGKLILTMVVQRLAKYIT